MSKQPKKEPGLLAPLAIGFFMGAITIGTLMLMWNHDREPRAYTVPVATAPSPMPAAAPAMEVQPFSGLPAATPLPAEAAVARVAARFDCSCGKCSDKLGDCNCETAQAERAFIQTQLNSGHDEAQAAEALNQKYGGLKS